LTATVPIARIDRRAKGGSIYAIIRSGGKQYRVEPDQVIDVDRLPATVGATIELSDVLMVAGDGDVQVGQPLVAGARVIAEVIEHGRDDKVVVFKYKAKTRYRRKKGHRQPYTRLAIRHILLAGESPPPAWEKSEEPAAEAEAQAQALARRKTARRPRGQASASESAGKRKAGSK